MMIFCWNWQQKNRWGDISWWDDMQANLYEGWGADVHCTLNDFIVQLTQGGGFNPISCPFHLIAGYVPTSLVPIVLSTSEGRVHGPFVTKQNENVLSASKKLVRSSCYVLKIFTTYRYHTNNWVRHHHRRHVVTSSVGNWWNHPEHHVAPYLITWYTFTTSSTTTLP